MSTTLCEMFMVKWIGTSMPSLCRQRRHFSLGVELEIKPKTTFPVPYLCTVVVCFLIHIYVCHFAFYSIAVSAVPDIHLQTMGSNATTMMSPVAMVETKDSPGSDFRRFMLSIYTIGLLFIVGSMVAVVWLTSSDLL